MFSLFLCAATDIGTANMKTKKEIIVLGSSTHPMVLAIPPGGKANVVGVKIIDLRYRFYSANYFIVGLYSCMVSNSLRF